MDIVYVHTYYRDVFSAKPKRVSSFRRDCVIDLFPISCLCSPPPPPSPPPPLSEVCLRHIRATTAFSPHLPLRVLPALFFVVRLSAYTLRRFRWLFVGLCVCVLVCSFVSQALGFVDAPAATNDGGGGSRPESGIEAALAALTAGGEKRAG